LSKIIQKVLDQLNVEDANLSAKTLGAQPPQPTADDPAPKAPRLSQPVVVAPVLRDHSYEDASLLLVVKLLPKWSDNPDSKVGGVLRKVEGLMDRPVDLPAHIIDIVPQAHGDMTVGETLKLLESHTSQRSGAINLNDLLAKATGQLYKSIATSTALKVSIDDTALVVQAKAVLSTFLTRV
jgi:hypothetical protein